MKIAKYVGELLFDYECVVIPGLGGFIAEDKSVTLNEVTDKFSPPYRKIHFNLHLRANDGLLVNYVAQQEQIGYKTAKQRVDKFVFLCHRALDEGKKINFSKIGSIAYDSDKNIIFKQDSTINYNSNAFGLSPVVSPSIRRVTDEEKVKKVVKTAINTAKKKSEKKEDRKPIQEKPVVKRTMQANRRKSPLTNQIIFLAIVFFGMAIAYGYMRRDAMVYYFDRYSSHFPFFYTSVNDYLSNNINSSPVARMSRGSASFFPVVLDKEESTPSGSLELKVNDNKVTNPDSKSTEDIQELDGSLSDKAENSEIVIIEPVPEDINTPSYAKAINETPEVIVEPEITDVPAKIITDRFFIIAGSFTNEANAHKLVNNLKSQGFKALIADTNKYGMYRVAFMSFDNKAMAENELVAIRNENNPKAWLLVK